VLQEIAAAFRLLASHPEAGHFRGDLTPLPVKFWPVFSYLIVYDPAARPLRHCAGAARPAGCRDDPLARRNNPGRV
jgi:plasmid stabilization system protein ParE